MRRTGARWIQHRQGAWRIHGQRISDAWGVLGGGGMEPESGYYLALILTIAGTLLYHLAQKMMPPRGSPFGLLAMAFAIALTLCLLLLLLTENASLRFSTNFNWSSLDVGSSLTIVWTDYLFAC